jgi:hypothetical protein
VSLLKELAREYYSPFVKIFVDLRRKLVIKQLSLPHQHINAYHYDNSLLFQFILAETLATLREANQLLEIQGDPQKIRQSMTRLVGTLNDSYRLFSWAPENGSLAKLRSYCSYFAHSADPHDNVLIPLVHTAEQNWLLGLVCLDDLRLIERTRSTPAHRTKLNKSLKELSTGLQKLCKMIAKLIEQFWNDENVIFFVLRNKGDFDALFGERFVKNLLKKMYLGGIWGAASFLSKRFAKRGFEHLVPIIEARIEEMDDG